MLVRRQSGEVRKGEKEKEGGKGRTPGERPGPGKRACGHDLRNCGSC